MCNVLMAVVWLLIFILVSFWVAFIGAGLYIFILPFTVCIGALTGITDFLLTVAQFPRYCAQNMMEGLGLK